MSGSLSAGTTSVRTGELGEVVLTYRENGELVLVSRQDEDGQILKILWEKDIPSRKPATIDYMRPNYDYE